MVKQIVTHLIFAGAGYLYGILLGFVGGMCGGAGHGNMFFYSLAYFPIGYGPLWWMIVGFLLCDTRVRAVRLLLRILLMAWYFSALLYLAVKGEILQDFAKDGLIVAPLLMVAAALFFGGQLFIWRLLLVVGQGTSRQPVRTD